MDTKYIDFDTHIYDSIDIWRDYLDPKFRDKSPTWTKDEHGRLLMNLDEKLYPSVPGHPGFGKLYGDKPEVDHTGNDPATRLKFMDKQGADIHVIFPTLGLAGFSGAVRDPVLAGAMARAYNRYMAEYTQIDRRRLRATMLLPMNHPEQAAEEMRWAHKNAGMRIAGIAPTPPNEIPWSDPSRDVVWQTAQELGVSISFHETTSGALPNALGIHRYQKRWPLVYLCTHVLEVQLAFADMILGGTLERFPNLKVAASEAHVHWLPSWLSLMDQQFGATTKIWAADGNEFSLSMKPSEYFKRQCFLAAFLQDDMIAEAVKAAPDSIVVCTDYPHPIAKVHGGDGAGLGELALNPTLTKEIAQRMLVDNPARFI